ncbi:hypothetical protein FISHEDRAFT_38423, partial [Fistulina hepatica ATCC 64428]
GSSTDDASSTSDFVKKLYKMLQDQSFQHVVAWAPNGDCFVVKDMNEFTKSVLPRMFKHSNFASFVRQLNKYDFHKVKNTDDSQFGEHSWVFRHPDFHANRPEALEHIKRKVPSARKPSTQVGDTSGRGLHYLDVYTQVARMEREKEEMQLRLRNMERNYQDILVELVGFQRGMAQQDGLMQNLLQYFLRDESQSSSSVSDENPFFTIPSSSTMPYSNTDVRSTTVPSNLVEPSGTVASSSYTANDASQPQEIASYSMPQDEQLGWRESQGDKLSPTGSDGGAEDEVFMASTRSDVYVDADRSRRTDSGAHNTQVRAAGHDDTQKANSSPTTRKKLPIGRQSVAPSWAISPRVLLVDDDAASRKLSCKFLQVYGCTTDVAADGVTAVTKMNLEKYDLVLMDIVMPHLDGVSATCLIRRFDLTTPIISMTGNAKPNEIVTYYSSGMNDVLAKPFSKQGLYDIVEKHLVHLKVTQHISIGAASGKQADDANEWEGAAIDPLGMNLVATPSAMLMQGADSDLGFLTVVATGKRPSTELEADERNTKRARIVEGSS